MREEFEEARERHFWGVVLGALATSLVLLAVLGVLTALTVALGWSRHLLPCALGLIAGASISVAAAGSARGRERTALVVGAITLPALAAHLAAVGAGGEAAFAAYSARLVPFLVHATGAVLGGVSIAAVWRPRAPRSAEDAAPQDRADTTAPPPEPSAPVERRSVPAEPTKQPSAEGATP